MISGEGEHFTLTRFHGTPDEVEEQWLTARRFGIGGSDVAAIMGLSPWKSAYEVWAEKAHGVSEDISERPAVQWGNILEPVVGEHFKSLHPDFAVRRVNGMASSLARPWAQASLDYEVNVPGRGWGVLEIKTAGLMSARHWEEGVPVFYATQVAHYLSVTGRPYAYVAVLIGGQDYREYLVERDEDDIAAVNAAVDAFWHDNVEADVAPEVTVGDGPTVLEVRGEATSDYEELSETPTLLSRYRLAKVEFDHARSELDRWSSKLKEAVGDAKGWDTPDGRLTWRRYERSKFDAKAFDLDHPGLRDKYITKKMTDGGLQWRDAKEGE